MREVGSFVARVSVAAVACSAAGVGVAACAWIVGDVHGHLQQDASVSPDALAEEMGDGGSAGPDAPSARASDAPGPDASSPPDVSSPSDALDVPDALHAGAACTPDLGGDTHNCGWCGHDCQGASCEGGVCSGQIVYSANPTGLAYDQGTLFYTGGPNGTIIALSLVSLIATTVAPAQNAATDIVARPPYLLWATADGIIHRALEDGGASTSLVKTSPSCLAASSTHVYWWETATGTAYSVPIDSDGSAPPTVEYVASAGAKGCVGADDQTFAVINGSTLVQRDLDSGTTTTAGLTGLADTRYVLLSGTYAVAFTSTVTDAGTVGHVNSVAKGSATAVDVGTFVWTNVLAAVGDDHGIYWSPQGEARIDGCQDALCSGGIRHYSPVYANSTLGSLALGPTTVYFSRGSSSGSILSVTR